MQKINKFLVGMAIMAFCSSGSVLAVAVEGVWYVNPQNAEICYCPVRLKATITTKTDDANWAAAATLISVNDCLYAKGTSRYVELSVCDAIVRQSVCMPDCLGWLTGAAADFSTFKNKVPLGIRGLLKSRQQQVIKELGYDEVAYAAMMNGIDWRGRPEKDVDAEVEACLAESDRVVDVAEKLGLAYPYGLLHKDQIAELEVRIAEEQLKYGALKDKVRDIADAQGVLDCMQGGAAGSSDGGASSMPSPHEASSRLGKAMRKYKKMVRALKAKVHNRRDNACWSKGALQIPESTPKALAAILKEVRDILKSDSVSVELRDKLQLYFDLKTRIHAYQSQLAHKEDGAAKEDSCKKGVDKKRRRAEEGEDDLSDLQIRLEGAEASLVRLLGEMRVRKGKDLDSVVTSIQALFRGYSERKELSYDRFEVLDDRDFAEDEPAAASAGGSSAGAGDGGGGSGTYV